MLESENEGKREDSNHGMLSSNVEAKKVVSLLLHVDIDVPIRTCKGSALNQELHLSSWYYNNIITNIAW